MTTTELDAPNFVEYVLLSGEYEKHPEGLTARMARCMLAITEEIRDRSWRGASPEWLRTSRPQGGDAMSQELQPRSAPIFRERAGALFHTDLITLMEAAYPLPRQSLSRANTPY